jgi:hypothetical protein
MGCSSGYSIAPGPCDNCRKPEAGMMGSSEWRSGYFCSSACGRRFTQRVGNGMVPDPGPAFGGIGGYYGSSRDKDRIQALRIRIKALEHRIRR